MKQPPDDTDKIIGRVKRAGAIILGVSENRPWIEVCYSGDLMHTERFELPADASAQIFVEEIPHKSTVLDPPRTMIYLERACDVEICREGNNVVVRGCKEAPAA